MHKRNKKKKKESKTVTDSLAADGVKAFKKDREK